MQNKLQSSRLAWLVVPMTAILAIVAVAWGLREPTWLARRYREQLPEVADSLVEEHLQRVAALGEPGLPVLTEALGSDRAAVRQAARYVLLDTVNRWELLPAGGATAKLNLLAHSLAEVSPQLDAEDRRFAADLATRLMLWPGATKDNRSGPLLADCETILAAVATRSGSGHPGRGIPADAADGQPKLLFSNSVAPDPALSLAQATELAGGGLPVELAQMPAARGIAEPRMIAGSGSEPREPNLFPEAAETRQPGLDSSNDGAGPPVANQPRRLPSPVGGANGPVVAAAQPVRSDVSSAQRATTADWKQMAPRDVMRRLHFSDPQVVAAARVELEHRGIKGPLVDLASRATDPDPKVRRDLAESLPRMNGIDARPWLLELSYDEDSQVRAAAVTLLATSGDLKSLRRLEQISRDDPDDYIREQAEKALPARSR